MNLSIEVDSPPSNSTRPSSRNDFASPLSIPRPPSGPKSSTGRPNTGVMPPPAPKKETRSTFTPSDMQMIATEIESLNKNIKDLKKVLTIKTDELQILNANKKTKLVERDIEVINTFI
jgi:hypothetical protein